MIQKDPKFKFADLFCGAGGFTSGAEKSGYARGVVAINHWRPAVATHRENHPHVRHVCASVDHVNPSDFDDFGINMVLASPECVGHSIARGGRPILDQRRATAWCVVRWAEANRPKWIVIENVKEFEAWGPVDRNGRKIKEREGEIFQAWIQALRACGYHVEWQKLNAANFGEAQSRIRLFVIARRGKTTKPINWPRPSHLPSEWVAAATIIDWSLPLPSIFGRKRPLVSNSIDRIVYGVRKFCRPEWVEPFLVKLRGTGKANSIHKPAPTITAGGNHLGLCVPFIVPNFGERDGQIPRTHDVMAPFPTVTPRGAGHLCVPFITKYYGTGKARSVLEPLDTVTTRDRYGLALVRAMDDLGIFDIGYRMFSVRELAAAQGFEADYYLHGTETEQKKQIGNAVSQKTATAIIKALAEDN